MMDSYLDFVDISFEGRSLQMRPSQLTTTNIARAFRLIPDTIILVSDRGTVALPTDGVFDDVDECYTWTVEGDKATNGGGSIAARAPKSGVERWKPKTFQPSISTATSHSVRKQGNGNSWIKSIEICSLRGDSGEVISYSEHPLAIEEGTATVSSVADKLSKEAFGGVKVQLLNSKNIMIADTEGTRGVKFWRSSKIIKAVSESDYSNLQRIRGGRSFGDPGPSRAPTILLSDSDSDGPVQPLMRKRKFKYVDESDSDSGQSKMKMQKTVSLLEDIQGGVKKINEVLSDQKSLKDLFTCLICKQVTLEESKPTIPPCCRSVVVCESCIKQWLETNAICPHCRSPLSFDNCMPQPLLRPMFELLQ